MSVERGWHGSGVPPCGESIIGAIKPLFSDRLFDFLRRPFMDSTFLLSGPDMEPTYPSSRPPTIPCKRPHAPFRVQRRVRGRRTRRIEEQAIETVSPCDCPYGMFSILRGIPI